MADKASNSDQEVIQESDRQGQIESESPSGVFWIVKQEIEERLATSGSRAWLARAINPNHLIKPELIFEIQTLGSDTGRLGELNVDDLRKKYRELRKEHVEGRGQIYRRNHNPDSVRIELAQIAKVIEWINSWCADLGNLGEAESRKELFLKCLSNISHGANRIVHLMTYARRENNTTLISELNQCLDELCALNSRLLEWQPISRTGSPVPYSTAVSTPVHTEAVVSEIPTKALTAPAFLPAGRPENTQYNLQASMTSSRIQNRNLTLHIPTPAQNFMPVMTSSSRVDPIVTTVSSHRNPVVSTLVSHNNQTDGLVGENVLSSFGSLYNKLHNPIELLLKDLPVTDGLVVEILLRFLKIALKIQSQFGVGDTQLFQILQPFALGPLSDRLTFAINTNSSFDQFHGEVLKYFIPQRLLSAIEREQFYRLQLSNEPLSSYIVSIREAAALLRLNLSECEIVTTICSGLNPAERSRLIFHGRPTSFQQLNEMSVQAQNMSYADQERTHIERSRNNSNVPNSLNFGNRDKTCFNCGLQGHIARMCRVKPAPKQFQNNNKVDVGKPDSNNKKGRGEVTCYTCRKPGHYSRDCKSKKS